MKYSTEIRFKDKGPHVQEFPTLSRALENLSIICTTLAIHSGRMAGVKVLGVSLHVKELHPEPEEVDPNLPWSIDPRANQRHEFKGE